MRCAQLLHTSLLWLCFCTGCRASTCLPDAKPAHARKMITVGKKQMPLKFGYMSWTSGTLIYEAVRIVLEEKIGYHAEKGVGSSSSSQMWMHLADCKTDEEGNMDTSSECQPGPVGSGEHLAFEIWESYSVGMDKKLKDEVPGRLPFKVGGLGGLGAEVFALKDKIIKKAEKNAVYLDWYKSYNLSTNESWQYFDSHLGIPKPDTPCDEVIQNVGVYLDDYVRLTGDTSIVATKDGKQTRKCDSNGWALSKACVELMETTGKGCIPVISYLGWGLHDLGQKAYWFNMPLAMGAFNWGPYVAINKANNTLTYWWTPDDTFLDLNEVIFPAFDPDQHAQSIYKSAMSGTPLLKLSSAAIKNEVLIQQFVKQISMSSQTIMNLVFASVGADKTNYSAVACKWMLENPSIWKSWVPDTTSCFRQQGLMDSEGVWATKDTVARGTQCDFCAPGRISESVNTVNGSKYLCRQCEKGHYQASPGQTVCAECSPGFYQPEVGQEVQLPCPVGKFRDAKVTSDRCQDCPEGMSTSAPGEKTGDSCRCNEGTFMPLSGSQCQPCPLAMECPFGSMAANIPKGAARLYLEVDAWRKAYPLVKPGHYSKDENPLFVYKCEPSVSCPGGQPSTCAGLRVGFMCSGCPGAYITNGDLEEDPEADGCTKCKVSHEVYLIIGIIVVLGAITFQLFTARTSPLLDSPTKVEIVSCFGQGLMFLQVLGAITSAQLSFGNPFNEVMDTGTSLVSMSAAFLGAPCIHHGFDDAVTVFLLKIVIPVGVMILTCIFFLIANVVIKNCLERDALLNCFGEILIEFYVSITIAVLGPFNCYSHPESGSSVFDSPEVICWEGDHTALMFLSVIGFFLYTLSSLSITFFAAWVHPRCMSKSDIGLLVRCHFLFNRWRPQCYWFCTVAVTRNCLIAMLPMVIPQKDLAVMLMTFTLVIPAALMTAVAPRRTPAMNALDALVSFTQIMILVVGAMSIYTGTLESAGLSWTVLILVLLVIIVGCSIIGVKCLQYITCNRSPLSWAFDIFVDHHGAGGASAARTLVILLTGLARKGKLFYDLDIHLQNPTGGNVLVIIDASKLSKFGVIALGNETWCRAWCVGAMCGMHLMRVRMCAIAFGARSDDFEKVITGKDGPDQSARRLSQGTEDEMVRRLSKQVPFDELRPMGIHDDQVPPAMQAVIQCPHLVCAMNTGDAAVSFLNQLFQEIAPPLVSTVQNAAEKLFGKPEITPQLAKLIISCDHSDPDGVAVSRLFYRFVEDLRERADPKLAPAAKYCIIQDIDLEAPDFRKFVEAGKVHGVIFIMTANTLTSVPQLLRLGFMYEYSTVQIRQYPVVISDLFSYPGQRQLDGIGIGVGLHFGVDPIQDSKQYTTVIVSLASVKQAVMDVLDRSICLCNVPAMTVPQVIRNLKDVLTVIADESNDPPKKRDPPGLKQTEDEILETYSFGSGDSVLREEMV